jgi:hypothetical protein
MPEIVHDIDLSAIEHRPGQSPDLEAKRLRAWGRLADDEKEWVLAAWDLTGMIPSAPAFRELKSAADRVLYVLVGTEESLTPGELVYLMIARWFRNIDPATARAKMAQLVGQGYARYTGIGRTMGTEAGLELLEEMALPPRQPREGELSYRAESDRREGVREPRRSTGPRKVDRGESPRSSFGDRSAPTGRYRSEIDEGEAPRPSRGESRGESRGDRGGDSRGPRRDDDRGGYSRGPSRDDRGGDSRGPRRDDRGGYSRGPSRDDRGGYSRGPSRDDRGGDSRGPNRDDRGGYSRGPSRDDRGGDSRGPSRDDRGGDSRGPRRDDRGGSPERGRVNNDGPIIDGNQPMERRINNDGPVIDGRDGAERRVNNDGPVIDGRDGAEQRINNDGPVIDGRDKKPDSSEE